LPDGDEAEEAAAEQRELLASFETQRCDAAARQFMVVERRAAAERVAEARAAACATAHRRNVVPARAAMAEMARVNNASTSWTDKGTSGGGSGGGAAKPRKPVPLLPALARV
jgi:hypothetical protein